MKKAILIALVLFGFLSCKDQTSSPVTNIERVFAEYYDFKKGINPIEATKAGFTTYNDTIANYISDDYQQFLQKKYTYFLEQLSHFDAVELTSAQRLSLRVMQWDCQVKLEGLSNELVTIASPMYDLPSFELMPLIQIQSLHLFVAQLAGGTSIQPFATVQDYDNWLERLEDYLIFLDTCIVKMKLGIDRKVVLPKVLVLKMIPQLQEFIHMPTMEHLFYKPVTVMPDYFSLEERDRLRMAYGNFITNKLIPTYAKLNDFLIHTYLPVSRETSGIGALPGGTKTYEYLIRLHTTSTLSADEIHELGQKEVARISKEMEEVKQQLGFNGTLKAFFDHIRSSPEQMPYTKAEEVIENFNTIRRRVDIHLDEVFRMRPKTDYEVRRTEAFREASASAEYVPGAKDASRSGIFYVPIPNVRAYNTFQDEALFLHEAVPGHHYQLSLQQENKELPEFLHPESMGVFVEGWALYAESLGKELGLYEDPYQYFGMLSMEMHRAIRLVVDTGMHAKGWTREEAIQYSLDHEAESEEGIIAEIERYMATPGQALSYKIGQLKIRGLRTKAERELGTAFDVRDFHSQVLNSGSLPLILLEEKIDQWIHSQKLK
ncbi:DUF885 domain-containing protein [Arenibacter sp. GZD96]|uniref:DUF885 domain-containing protein n=1 Tax=Aurantibrevibacter litoralis TaxID=3106030 RepID=UPI002AFE0EA3|nr:DUF885 domain-containing protein [Arenibacter sp. GZD-96]MEA1785130.1 DUF885 domain-containing protein [Arenibacter sp. GZD-96]